MSRNRDTCTAKDYARKGLISFVFSFLINVLIGVSWEYKTPVKFTLLPSIFLTSLAYLTYKQIQKDNYMKIQIPVLFLGIFGLYMPFGLFFGGIFFLLTYKNIESVIKAQEPFYISIRTSVDNEIKMRKQKLWTNKIKRFTSIGLIFFVLTTIGIVQGVIRIILDPPHTYASNRIRVGMYKVWSAYYHAYFLPILILIGFLFVGLTITAYMAYWKTVKGYCKAAYFNYLFLGSIGLIGSFIIGIFERKALLTHLFTILSISRMSSFILLYISTYLFIIPGFPSILCFLSGVFFLLVYRELGIMLKTSFEITPTRT